MIAVTAAAVSDLGCVRRNNEDSYYVGKNIWAVADGMGGHAAGEIASAIAVSGLAELDEQPNFSDAELLSQIQRLNQQILDYGEANPEAHGLGTTVSGIARVADPEPHWLIFNIGDSRVYRMAEGGFHLMTIDHSEVELLAQRGLISRDQMRTHPLRNYITRSLGFETAPEVDSWQVPIKSGEQFLICSDGLTGELSDDMLSTHLADENQPEPATTLANLVAAAKAAGGRDNITAVLLSVA